MSNTKQADGEIHEDQLLNFLVNALDEEVALTLAENAEIDAEDIYEALFCRRLLTLLSCRCGVEEDKDTASAVSDTNDSAGCVWVGIGRSGPVTAGSLA